MKTHLLPFRQRLFLLLLVAIACFAYSGSARADTHLYMKFGALKGSVVATGHVDEIELASVQYGTGRNIGSPTGSSDRESSAPSISEVSVTCAFDSKAYADLFLASCSGTGVKVEIFTVVQNGPGGSFVPLKLQLDNTLISGFSSAISTGDSGAGFFTLSLNFTKITVTTTGIDPSNGSTTTPVVKSYDLATQTAGN